MNVQLTNDLDIAKDALTEVTDQHESSTDKHFLKSNTLTQSLLDLVNDAIVITDKFGYISFINSQAEQILGLSAKDVQTQPMSSVFEFLHEMTSAILESPIQRVLQKDLSVRNSSCTLNIKNSRRSLSIEYSVEPIYDNDSNITGAVLVLVDTSNSRQLAHQLSWQLNHDSLTGLVNRYSFEASLEQAVSTAKSSGQQHVLCYLDLDQFNVINDTCGHVAGDIVLKQISALFLNRVRKSDILARLGGDEFGLILYQCDLEQALSVIHLLRKSVQQFRFDWDEKVFNFSVSIGVVTLDGNIEDPSHVLSMVNLACDAAKGKGRNRLHVYQAHDQDIASQRGEVQWIPRIYRALEENQFCLYSQPITPVALNTSTNEPQFSAFQEVLIRLEGQDGEMILPGHFIPVAERYGLMHLIDQWVIRNLFAHIQSQQLLSGESSLDQEPNCQFTINLSGASLNDDQFLDFVKEQFEHYGIAPHLICFEITETLAIANLSKATELIHKIKDLGCYFALDDFGSGMSSFGYLQQLPIDYLKIDGVFIQNLMQGLVAVEIVKSINQIAHVIGIKTVAEYVETEEILYKLRGLEVDYAQGFHIAKPSLLSANGPLNS